jgi:hypothetical protein
MTTKQEIEGWLKEGMNRGARWVVVACDTFDHEDYPIYVEAGEDVNRVVEEHNDSSKMSLVMEVYSLERDLQEQLNETRAWHLD